MDSGPIVLDRFSVLHATDHRLLAFCEACGHRAWLDLPALIARYGDRMTVGMRVRCNACGAPGRLQLHPPMPEWGGYPAWPKLKEPGDPAV